MQNGRRQTRFWKALEGLGVRGSWRSLSGLLMLRAANPTVSVMKPVVLRLHEQDASVCSTNKPPHERHSKPFSLKASLRLETFTA